MEFCKIERGQCCLGTAAKTAALGGYIEKNLPLIPGRNQITAKMLQNAICLARARVLKASLYNNLLFRFKICLQCHTGFHGNG